MMLDDRNMHPLAKLAIIMVMPAMYNISRPLLMVRYSHSVTVIESNTDRSEAVIYETFIIMLCIYWGLKFQASTSTIY